MNAPNAPGPELGWTVAPAEEGALLIARPGPMPGEGWVHRLEALAPGADPQASIERVRPCGLKLTRLEVELPLARVRTGARTALAFTDDVLDVFLEDDGEVLLARATIAPEPRGDAGPEARAYRLQVFDAVGPNSLLDRLLAGFERAFGGLEGREGPTTRLDPLAEVLRLFPSSGFKLPAVETSFALARGGPRGGLLLSLGARAPSAAAVARSERIEPEPADHLALADRLRAGGERRRPSWLLALAARTARPEERARLLEQAVGLQPDEPGVLRAWIDALAPLGRTSAAVRASRRLAGLVRTDEERASAHATAARLLAAEGDLSGAERAFEQALDAQPVDGRFSVELAEVRRRRGDVEGARRALQDASGPAVARALAALELQSDRPDAAVAAAAEPGEDPELAALLIEAAARAGRPEAAGPALALADALESRPYAAAQANLARAAARAHAAAGRPDRAARQLGRLRQPGQGVETLRGLVELAQEVGDRETSRWAGLALADALWPTEPEAAAEAWRLALSGLSPTDRQWEQIRSRVTEAAEKDPARPLLELALELGKDAGDVGTIRALIPMRLRYDDAPEVRAKWLGELGLAHRAVGKPLSAARAFEEASRLQPARIEWLERVVDAHRARDDRPRLAEALGRLAAALPLADSGPHHAERARILAALGEDEAAHAAARAALGAGDSAPLTASLAIVLSLRLGRAKEARELAEARVEAVLGGPPSARVAANLDLARVAEAQGDTRRLSEVLAEALAVSEPGSATERQVAERLGAVLAAAGDHAALARLERRRAEGAAPPERAARLVSAAEKFLAAGEPTEAVGAAELALEVEGSSAVEASRARALVVLEQLARAAHDPSRVAEVLRLRAERAGTAAEGERLFLELIDLLEPVATAEALSAARRAVELHPDSGPCLVRLGSVAESAGDLEGAGRAFSAAAGRARDTEEQARLHARAAAAFVGSGQLHLAAPHDERVVELARARGASGPLVEAALDRLEGRARERGDPWELMRLLEVRVALSDGEPRAEALEAFAGFAFSVGRVDDALAALDEARRSLSGARADAVEEQLDAARARAGRSRDRVAAFERRAQASSRSEAATLWRRAAEVLATDLDDRVAALVRARSAVQSDPADQAARSLRLDLLRGGDAPDELADALEEEAALAADAALAARWWLEACRALLSSSPTVEHRLRAAALARRAAVAAPRDVEPLRRGIEALDGLEGQEQELLGLLGQLASRTPRLEERIVARLRRARLLERFDDPTGALAELGAVLAAPDAPRRQALATVSSADDADRVVFRWGAELARRAGDPEAEEVFLFRWQGVAGQAERVEVAARRAGLLASELGDAEGSEAAWLEVLDLKPDHDAARSALLGRYLETGRFDALADRLGLDALEATWRDGTGPSRALAAAALWPRLPDGARRAEVQLDLADAHWAAGELAAAEPLLVAVSEGGSPDATRALGRLAQLRKARGDPAGAADAEAARASASVDVEEQADARAREADLRLEAEDLRGAEAAAKSALATGRRPLLAVAALERVLLIERRYVELGQAVGPDALEAALEARLVEAPVDALDIAGALAAHRAPPWLRVADALYAAGEEAREREALEAAATGSEGEAALERLARRAEEAGELERRAEALRRLAARDAAPPVRLERRLAHAAALRAWAADGGPSAAEAEAESVLLGARQEGADPRIDDALESLWVDGGQLLRVGQELGIERLATLAARAREEGLTEIERPALAARAELAVGSERADALVQLARLEVGPAELDALIAAVEADSGHPEARAALGDRLFSDGDYGRLARSLGPEALEARLGGDLVSAPEAAEALALAWEQAGAPRAEVWCAAGLGHRGAGWLDTAERCFRAALSAEPGHAKAKEALAALLGSAARYEDLADLDVGLVEALASAARVEDDPQTALAALRAVAARRTGPTKARVLLDVAELAREIEGLPSARAALEAAVEAAPDDGAARTGLLDALWAEPDPVRIIERLGATALFERATAEPDPRVSIRALQSSREALSAEDRARADELLGRLSDPDGQEGLDTLRRADALRSARFTWDQLGRRDEGIRVRLGLVELLRGGGPRAAYLEALEDAWQELRRAEPMAPATAPEAASIGLEWGRALGADRPAGRAVLGALLDADDATAQAAAELLFAADAHTEPERERRLAAGARLARLGALDALGLERLADLGVEAGWRTEEVAAPLEAAVPLASDPEPVLRRLLAMWDEAGVWDRAEPHAAALAERTGAGSDWLTVSELRSWLDDLDGAEAAAAAALAVSPNDARVHERRVALAERRGDSAELAERLVAYAEADRAAPASLGADRLLSAAEASLRAGSAAFAGSALVRAAALDPTADRLDKVDRLLEAHESLVEDRLHVLRTAVSRPLCPPDRSRTTEFRLRLVALLERLGRSEEARTALAAGFVPPLEPDDPLMEAALADSRSEAELIALAERLGDGPAARRLWAEAARRSEAQGDTEGTRRAWSQVASSAVQGTEDGELARSALLRLARTDPDPEVLLDALEERAEDDPDPAPLWLEAAEVAEIRLDAADRAAALLERGHRATAAPALAEAYIALAERHGRWEALDAWLDEQRKHAEGPVRARWATRQATVRLERLADAAGAADLFAEADRLDPSVEAAIASARAERARGDPEASVRRAEQVLARAETGRAERLEMVGLQVEALDRLGRPTEADAALARAADALPEAEGLFETWARRLDSRQDRLGLASALLADWPPEVAGERARAAILLVPELGGAGTRLEEAATPAERLAVARAFVAIGQPDPARALLEDPIEDAGPRYSLARVELGLADPATLASDPAVPAHLRARALAQVPSPDARRDGAHLLEPSHPEAAAEAWASLALTWAADGDTGSALWAVGRVERLVGEATALQSQVLEIAVPTHARADALVEAARADGRPGTWTSAAEALAAVGRFEEAEEAQFEARAASGLPEEEAGIEELARGLQQRERWETLSEVLERWIERSGRRPEEERALRLWAGRVALRRGERSTAKRHFERAIQTDPLDLEVAEAAWPVFAKDGEGDRALALLEELATRSQRPGSSWAALVAAARLHAEAGRVGPALEALEAGQRPERRSWTEEVERAALAAGMPERAARAWARHAAAVEGPDAAAAFARAAELRWVEAADLRGAIAAAEAACRRAPGDVGIARLAVELYGQLGDPGRMAEHAQRCGATGMALASLAVEAARLGDRFEPWGWALDVDEARPLVLEHLASRHRLAAMPGLEDALAARGLALPPPSPEGLPMEVDEARWAELDRGGRWLELAELEAERAAAIDDPRGRASGWLDVAKLHARSQGAGGRAEERLALERAIEADPLWTRPLVEALLRCEQEGDGPRAQALVARIEALGGPAWAPPRFELLAARLVPEEADRWLRRALARCPSHPEVLSALAERRLAEGGLGEAASLVARWRSHIDPVLDPEAAAAAARLGARVDAARGRLDEALGQLDRERDADLRAQLLDGAPAEVRSEALEAWFRLDADPSHLVEAAALGVRLDELEACAPDAPELDAAFVAARAAADDGPALLRWWRRRGGSVFSGAEDRFGALGSSARQALAVAALDAGEAALLGELTDESALESAIGSDPIPAVLLARLSGHRSSDQALLCRLARLRPKDPRVARRRVALGFEGPTLEPALRRLLELDPGDPELLRSLLGLIRGRPEAVFAEALLAWVERGEEVEFDAHARPLPDPGPGPFDELRPYPWPVERLDERDGWLVDREGGTSVWLGPSGAPIVGVALLESATPAELRFHRARAEASPGRRADDPTPERRGWLAARSLGAALRGLERASLPSRIRPAADPEGRRRRLSSASARDLALACLAASDRT